MARMHSDVIVEMDKWKIKHTSILTIIEGREKASNGFPYQFSKGFPFQFTTGKPLKNLELTINYY